MEEPWGFKLSRFAAFLLAVGHALVTLRKCVTVLVAVLGSCLVVGFGVTTANASVDSQAEATYGQMLAPTGVGVKREIKSDRTLFSKTWALRDGRELTRVSAVPVHYRNSNGDLVDLDLSVKSSDSGDLSGQVGKAQVDLPDRLQRGTDVTYGTDSMTLTFNGPLGEESVDGSSVQLDGVLPGVDRDLSLNPAGVEEKLVLDGPDAPRTFSYTLELGSGLSPRTTDDGAIQISKGEDEVFTIPAVVAYEQDAPVPVTIENAYALERKGDGVWKLTVDVDGKWLNYEKRSWPVVIDPSVVVDPLLGVASDFCLRTASTGACASVTSAVNVGWGQGVNLYGSLIYSSMVLKNFVVPTTLNSRIVSDAKLGIYQNYAWGRPGTAASMPPYPGAGGTSYPLPGVASQTLEVSPVTNPNNMNWPLREAPLDRKVVAAGSGTSFDVTSEVRAWIANRLNSANGWAQRSLGIRTAGTPLSTQDVNGCRIDLNTAACQGQYSQIAGIADADTAKQPHLDVFSYPPAQSGSVIKSPEEGQLTSRFVELRADASSSNVTTAKFQYVAGSNRDWQDIPASALKKLSDGTTMTSSEVPIGYVDGGANDALVWDLQATPGGEDDGPVHLRAILETSAGAPGGGATPEVNFRLDRRDPAAASSQTVGPASVNLMSGDVSITDTDADISAFLGDLSLSRTYHSRGVAPRNEDMFGPGWISGFESDDSSSPFKSIYSYSEVKEGEEVQQWMLDDAAAQSGSYDGDDFANESPGEIPRFEVKYAVLEMNDGSKVTFTLRGGQWEPDDEFSMYELSLSGSVFTVTDLFDGKTSFTQEVTGSPRYLPTNYREEGDSSGVTYEYSVSGTSKRLLRIIAPRPGTTASCSTPSTWPDDCRALEIGWTNITVGGKSVPRVGSLILRAWDPSGQVSGNFHTIATYEYDTSGRLKKVSDPRISGGLPTQYSYDSNGRITSYTPPGLKPWNFTYGTTTGDDGDGRVKSISRETADGDNATVTFVYDVPLSGSSAPADLSPATISTWGQSQKPQTATAVFPPENVPSGTGLPSSWTGASVFYLSTAGQTTNVLSANGGIATSEYDKYGNVVRELTPANRAVALAAGSGSVAKSYKVDTQYEYAANGIDLITTIGPETQIRRPDGSTVTARRRVAMAYDDNKPSSFSGEQHLVTAVREGAVLSSGTVIDEDVTTYAYSNGTSDRGWEIGKPLSVTEGSGAEQQVTQYEYYADYPLLKRETRPRSSGTDAQTTSYEYYGIQAGILFPGAMFCNTSAVVKIAAASGTLCHSGPAAQPTGQPLNGKIYRYSLLWDVIEQRDATDPVAAGTGQNRVTTISRDAIGRETIKSISSSTGTSVPPIVSTYDSNTGLPLATVTLRSTTDSSQNDVVARSWDNNGLMTSYTDANGNTTSYDYDLSGRPEYISDSLGSRELEYDTAGMLSEVGDSKLPGPITAERNLDGAIVAENFPGNVRMERTLNTNGEAVAQNWKWTSGCSTSCAITSSSSELDAQGRIVRLDSDQSGDAYTYDTIGRLKQSDDTRAGICKRVQYGYDQSSNRTSQSTTASASGNACGTGSTTSRTNTFDTADRITNSGYVYDVLGRTTAIPAADSPNGSVTYVNYRTDDRPTQIWAGSTLQQLTYDPLQRIMADTTQATGLASTASKMMYGSDAQTASGKTGSWGSERYIPDIEGNQVAMSNGSSAVLYLSNLRGDVTATMNVGANSTTSRVEYTPFGQVAGSSGTLRTTGLQPGFVGTAGAQAVANVGGYVHMGARVYNPSSGRFLQMDPITGGSANSYDYADQDPMNQLDLSGYCVGELHTVLREGFATFHICKRLTHRISYILNQDYSAAALGSATGAICGVLGGGPIGAAICGFATDLITIKMSRLFRLAARNRQCVTITADIDHHWEGSLPFRHPVWRFSVDFNRSTHRDYCD